MSAVSGFRAPSISVGEIGGIGAAREQVVKKQGEYLTMSYSPKYQGPAAFFRLELQLGACPFGGCGVPGPWTGEPGLHWHSIVEIREDVYTFTEVIFAISRAEIPLNAKVKDYDARVWITGPYATITGAGAGGKGMVTGSEQRITNPVKIVVAGKAAEFISGAGDVTFV